MTMGAIATTTDNTATWCASDAASAVAETRTLETGASSSGTTLDTATSTTTRQQVHSNAHPNSHTYSNPHPNPYIYSHTTHAHEFGSFSLIYQIRPCSKTYSRDTSLAKWGFDKLDK